MIELKTLRGNFKTEFAYLSFISKLEDMLYDVRQEYYFLGFSDERWYFYLNKSVELNLKDLKWQNINLTMIRALKNYIKNEALKKRPQILNNLLRIIAYNNKGYFNILKKFIRSLELYEIKMDEEYFKILVLSSPILTKILQHLAVDDFSFADLKKFLEGKKLSNNFKCPGYTQNVNADLFNYVMSCLKNESEVRQKIAEGKIDDVYNKVSLFIRKYETILKIHALFNKLICKVNTKVLDMAILSLSYKELNEFLNGYYKYIADGKDSTFLNIVAARVDVKKEGTEEKTEPPKKSDARVAKKNTGNHKDSKSTDSKKAKRKLSLEDRFPLIDGMTTKERNQIVKKLYSELSIEEKQLIDDYLLDKLEDGDKRAENIIAKMRKKYRRYGKKLLDIDFDLKKKMESFEKFFPLIHDITSETRSKIISVLISQSPDKYKQLYERYINGELTSGMKEYVSFKTMKNSLLNVYFKDGIKILNPDYKMNIRLEENRDLHSYFVVQKGMTEQEKNQIVDILFGLASEEIRKLINDYLLKKETNKSLTSDFFKYINAMRKTYQNYGKIILTPFYKPSCKLNDVYSLFGLTPTMSEEERNKAVDAYLEGKFYFDYVLRIFKDLTVELKNDLEEKDKKVFSDALKVIEYVYREKRKMTRPSYYEYFKKRVIEIYTNGSNSLTDIIRLYIEIEVLELNKGRKKSV